MKELMTVTNHEGAKAYATTPELELYTAVVTASLSDLCYEKQDERVGRIAALVRKVSPMLKSLYRSVFCSTQVETQ